MYFVSQNIFSQFYSRLFEFGHHSPFKTGKQSFLHSLQQHRCTVGSQNQLFAVLVQMIEDVEERILSFSNARKFLNVINDQNVDCLVEIDEIISRIVSYRIGVLYLK